MNKYIFIIISFIIFLFGFNISNSKPINENSERIFGKTNNCSCLKHDSTVLYIDNLDTLIIENKFLLSDKLEYSTSNSLDRIITRLDTNFSHVGQNCYSDKYRLNDGYYLIQVISQFGGSDTYILGNSKSKKLKIYTVTYSNEFDNYIWVEDFINLLKDKSSSSQIIELTLRLRTVTKWNQKKFPIFPR